MPAPVLQFKRGNAGVAGTVPALRPGEPALSLNNFDFFVGFDTTVAGNKFFGSHRYWGREDGTTSLRLKLVDKTGIGGTIQLKTPDSHTGVTTYTLPSTPIAGNFLKVDANGVLSWDTVSGSASFTNSTLTGVTTITNRLDNQANTSNSGITTFTNTTDNTLGNSNTGAVQIDGGLGVDKNVTVGGNLNVQGYSEFVGVVTFRGGTITVGDQSTDQINVGGQFISSITPYTDNTYDIGTGSQRWRNANFAGIATVGGFTNNGTTTLVGNVQMNSNLNVNGNITLGIGGTSYYNAALTTLIRDKDIVLGVTTDLSLYPDTSTDTTANHGGVSIASTQGTPLCSFTAVGINSLADTYKQMMWFKSGTLGFSTDAFAFNYGVAIGTTTMANGVRLAVGSNITMTDTTVTATTGSFTNLTGTLTGTISTATKATLVDTTTAPNGTFYPGLFVNSTGTATTAVYVDSGISYVSDTDTLTLTGNLAVNGGNVTTTSSTANIVNANATTVNFAGAASNLVIASASGITTVRNKLTVGGNLELDGNTIQSSTGANVISLSGSTASFASDVTVGGNLYVNGNTTQVNTSELQVYDRTITLGIQSGTSPATTTWDLGILMNYGDAGVAKTAGVVWESANKRFQFSTSSNNLAGIDNNTPQISVTTFAPIEIAELWVNNTCTGGAQQVISCVGSELNLQNITIDAGIF